MAIEIVIADDHRLVREAIAQMLNRTADFDVVAECGDGVEACHAIHELDPDVALLDLSMPRKGGIAVARDVRQAGATCNFVLLTMHADPAIVQQANAQGVDVVVLKDDAAEDLVHAIRCAVDKRRFVRRRAHAQSAVG